MSLSLIEIIHHPLVCGVGSSHSLRHSVVWLCELIKVLVLLPATVSFLDQSLILHLVKYLVRKSSSLIIFYLVKDTSLSRLVSIVPTCRHGELNRIHDVAKEESVLVSLVNEHIGHAVLQSIEASYWKASHSQECSKLTWEST